MKNKINLVINIILAILLLGSLGGLYYFYNQNKEKENQIISLKNQMQTYQNDNIDENDTAIDNNWLGVINIPSIGLKENFVNGVNDQNCVEYNICNYTEFPSKNKNFLLGAHSSLSKVGYFYHISELKKGDIAYISDSDNKYEYELTNIFYRNKSDDSIETNDNASLTLFTTDKNNPNKRFLVLSFKLVKTTNNPDKQVVKD